MGEAAFRFLGYKFTKIAFDFSNVNPEEEMSVDISTSGTFIPKQRKYELKFVFTATNTQRDEKLIEIECLSQFVFVNELTLDEIPSYFYPNSIAIVFPYVRAFISSVSIQAGIPPIVLPTYNLFVLQEDLKRNTHVVENG